MPPETKTADPRTSDLGVLINGLQVNRVLTSSPAESLRQLDVTGADLEYGTGLLQRFRGEGAPSYRIGENFTPTALMSEQERRALGIVDYGTMVKGFYLNTARATHLRAIPMDAGIGSNLERTDFVAQHANRTMRLDSETGEIDTSIGAKGLDLTYPIMVERRGEHGRHFLHMNLPTMAIKNLRLMQESGQFAGVTLQECLNAESAVSVHRFLASEFPFLNGVSWTDALQRRQIELADPLMQNNLPTIDAVTGELTTDRMAPGSHGQIGTMLLHDIAEQPIDPDGKPRVAAVYNGDGVNNSVSAEMVGFTVRERAGVVLVSTTRTKNDVKGGVLGVSETGGGGKALQIIELVQAKREGQEKEFLALGMEDDSALPANLRDHHQPGEQLFNTNTVLLNEGTLGPFLKQLKAAIGDEAFAGAISPNLIENTKVQNGRSYIQLEGALSSVMFNLNRFVMTNPVARDLWKSVSGNKPFLRVINLDPDERLAYFTPTKYTPDYLLYAHSDHYKVNPQTWALENQVEGHVPAFGDQLVQGEHYKDVTRARNALGWRLRTKGLDYLNINGKVNMRNVDPTGSVDVQSENPDEIEITHENAPDVLKQPGEPRLKAANVTIYIDAQGKVTASPFS